jgi:hypothetical protein
MMNVSKASRILFLMSLYILLIPNQGYGRAGSGQQLHITLIGFADRWADYGSRGTTPGFRDFLGVLHQPTGGKSSRDIFVKVRFLYWQEGKSDPKSFSEADQQERVFKAQRDSSCDETFASLSHEGDISYLDPQSKPSRFIHLPGKLTGLPSPKAALPCYEIE